MLAPAEIQHQYQQMLTDGAALDLQTRLAQKDLTLWSSNPQVQEKINTRLGWLDCIDSLHNQVDSILKISQGIYDQGFRHCILLGMGGSSLAPELFSKMYSNSNQEKALTLEVVDTTSPDEIDHVLKSLNLHQTLFVVASKSGTTIESDCLFRFFYDQLIQARITCPGQHFIAITDAGTVLEQIAKDKNFVYCFINPADIGGRFSVLSYFGLFPAALLGVDIKRLLTKAKTELAACQSTQLISEATKLGIILGLAYEQGLDKLQIKLACELEPFAAWLEQLVAESTGKSGQGILPLIESIELDSDDPSADFVVTLTDKCSGHNQPVFSQDFNISNIGAEFFKWEWATAIAASIMRVNPFDEPNVGENKAITIQKLDALNSENYKNIETFSSNSIMLNSSNEATIKYKLEQLIQSIQPADYLAILSYGINKDILDDQLQNYREKLKSEYSVLSTTGIGPRYLHSTGQLHKGGANNGVFLVITSNFENNLDIPGKTYTFQQLNHAQAMGDIQALEEKGRRLLHLHLNQANQSNLRLLVEIFNSSLART